MKNAETTRSASNKPRQSQSLARERFCLWQGFAATEGLAQFRNDERYSVWMHTHRRLLLANRSYANAVWWFNIASVCCILLAIGLWCYLSSAVLAATFALACLVVLTYREQRRRNECISAMLREPATCLNNTR